MLEANPGLEEKVGGDEERFMALAQAIDKALSEHVQLKSLEVCGTTKSGPVVRTVSKQKKQSEEVGRNLFSRRQ
jgi:hypothetical protein